MGFSHGTTLETHDRGHDHGIVQALAGILGTAGRCQRDAANGPLAGQDAVNLSGCSRE
jgi:hypothetical protein